MSEAGAAAEWSDCMKKRTAGEKCFTIINTAILILIVFISVYPLWHVMMASFSENTEVLRHRGLLLWPLGKINIGAYEVVFQNPMVVRGYLNTIFVVVVGCSVNIFMTCIAAYVLSRRDFMWRRFLTVMIVITMYFSGGLIPFYFTVKDLHLDGSLWSLIIPVSINAFNLIILRTSFEGVPESLLESARIDGARHFSILFKIVVPLTLPAIAVMILYYGVAHWNSWFNAMIFLRTNRESYPLQLVLREILLQNTMQDSVSINTDNRPDIGETVRYALIMVATVPILCIYPFLQKYFVKGVLVGAVKE